MAHEEKMARERRPDGIPMGDLERIRELNLCYRAWVGEWDFIRDAVRRRLDEFGQKYANADRR